MHWWGDNLGAAAADELTTQLLQTGKFTVIERAQLAAVLGEQDLGASGRVTSATAAKVGELLGVQLLFTGSITQFSVQRTSIGFRGIGGSYSNAESVLDVRLINTTSGEILLTAEGQGNKRMGGGYFKGANAERTFEQGAAQEALRPAVEAVIAKVSAQAASSRHSSRLRRKARSSVSATARSISTGARTSASRSDSDSRCTASLTRSRTPMARSSTA